MSSLIMLFQKYREKRNQLKDLRGVSKLLSAHRRELILRKTAFPEDIFDVTEFFLRQNADLFDSIATLHKGGHFQSCVVLARSLIENAINLQYIYRDDIEQRAKNFKLFTLKQYVGRADTVEDFPGKKDFVGSMEKILEDYKPNGKRKHHWDGRSFKAICDELKMGSTYESIYSRLSEYSHSGFTRKTDYTESGPYNDFLRSLVFRYSVLMTAQTLKDINQRYDLLIGFIHMSDYPKNTDLFFSFSNKKHEPNL